MIFGKSCFVVSPIGSRGSVERKHADLVLNYIVRPVAQDKFGYEVVRGDELAHSGMITVDVINSILAADLVVADLSFLNPNVFYELALRHYSRKPVIHIASSDTKLPFDNADHRAILYDLLDWESHERTRRTLAALIEAVEHPGYSVSNPVTIAQAHDNDSRNAEALEIMSGALKQLEEKIENLLTGIVPEGRITKRGITQAIGGHRKEILEIVTAMRQRIDLRMKGQDSSGVRAADMLSRLGKLEEIVRGNTAVH